jgi:DNA mismatch repair protein MutS
MTNLPFSLLWPSGRQPHDTVVTLTPTAVHDLSLQRTISEMCRSHHEREQIHKTLTTLITDPAIIQYRQAILTDLWQSPPLRDCLLLLAPHIHGLEEYRRAVDRPRTSLEQIAWRLGELESMVLCVTEFQAVFALVGDSLQAEGWQRLRTLVAGVAADPLFQQLQRNLPELLQQARIKASVTIGVNLDTRLRPVAATLLAINDEKFTASGFLDKLLGRGGRAGLGPLHEVPPVSQQELDTAVGREFSPLMVPLFRDLADILERTSQPVAKLLGQYVSLQSQFLADMSQDVTFYLAAVQLLQKLEAAGLPLCMPQIAPQEARLCEIEDGYNLNLALYLLKMDLGLGQMVLNDVHLGDEHGRVAILTGPNQGGKTTYTQMVGLCQLLAQAGLWVPARTATISPVDGIYTHYPTEEQLERATGRFGDEAERLSRLFDHATRHSLILLNESLSSTSPGESLYLAQDIVRILRLMGTRAIFGTHLHQLAAEVDRLNAETSGDSQIFSLTASTITTTDEPNAPLSRSYKIAPGPPAGRSYATEIARKYGISYDQLRDRLASRSAEK